MELVQRVASSTGQPLWRTLSQAGVNPRMPVPHFNVVIGRVHAPDDLNFAGVHDCPDQSAVTRRSGQSPAPRCTPR